MTQNETLTTLPIYQSHKKVKAVKISAVEIAEMGTAYIASRELNEGERIEAPPGWADRFHGDEEDLGYWVQYADGYQSWSPSAAFQDGYTRIQSEEEKIEQEIKDKGLKHPRVTPRDIDQAILGEQYHVFQGTTVTVCCLTLRNGYNVIGMSAAVSPENFDVDIGMKVSRANARNQIWALEGYLMRHNLYRRDLMEKEAEAGL